MATTDMDERRKLLQTVLEDDDTPFGGVSHAGETLEEFLIETGYNVNAPLSVINLALIECGIKPLKGCDD